MKEKKARGGDVNETRAQQPLPLDPWLAIPVRMTGPIISLSLRHKNEKDDRESREKIGGSWRDVWNKSLTVAEDVCPAELKKGPRGKGRRGIPRGFSVR